MADDDNNDDYFNAYENDDGLDMAEQVENPREQAAQLAELRHD